MEIIEKLKENSVRYIKTIAMDIVVVIVAIAYVFYQMVKLEATSLNPLVLIAEAIMGIICGVIIKAALGENGFSKGYNSKIWLIENEKYNDACSLAIDYTERLDNFYLEIEKEKKMNYRRSHLQALRMKYSMWFDNNGDYIGTQENYYKLTWYQKIGLKKCIRVKIYVLNLFGEYSTASEQDTKREVTDKVQRGRNITKNTLAATLVAIIGVYFLPIFNWNIASLISSTMQVALWILFGILQLYTNYNFVVQDKVSVLRKKKELIARFVKDSQNGKYIVSPYEQKDATIKEEVATVEE